MRENSIGTKIFNTFATLLLTGAMLWGLQAKSTSTSLNFVHLTDVHYMENGTNTTFKMIGESPRLLDDAIEQINDIEDLDFTMITGDLIDKPFEKELKSALVHLDNLNSPWYFAFGNHDRCYGGYLNTDIYLKLIRENNKNFKFKKGYYSFTPKKGYKVIVLDNIITNEITSNGFIGTDQMNWLKNELDSSKNETVLVFMHVPVLEPYISPNHKLRNSSALMSLLERYDNPIGVFQGHYHATKVTQHKNVLYVSTPALVSYPNAFRRITVTNYKDKTVFELNWYETRQKTIQKLAKIMVFSGLIYAGEPKDQSGIYEIQK